MSCRHAETHLNLKQQAASLQSAHATQPSNRRKRMMPWAHLQGSFCHAARRITLAVDLVTVDESGRIVAPVLEPAVVVRTRPGSQLAHQLVSTGRLFQSNCRLAIVGHLTAERVAGSDKAGCVASCDVVLECQLTRRRQRLTDVSCTVKNTVVDNGLRPPQCCPPGSHFEHTPV